MGRIISFSAVVFGLAALVLPGTALAQRSVCPRPEAGAVVAPPPDLYSRNGVLRVAFNYETRVDDRGRTLFCYQTPKGLESPTLHVNPGDTIKISLTNTLPTVPGGPQEAASAKGPVCGDGTMTLTSVNMHFHGTNTSPRCHSDEVIHTLVNSGETFAYTLKIPKDEPPGLYWYHPHVHGVSSVNVQGGATGAIIVEGIEKIEPAVAGLPERLLLLRDGPLANPELVTAPKGLSGPSWDVSVNYVPVPFPRYEPAVIKMQEGSKEFWRVANTSADTIFDVQLMYDGVAQPMQIAALDGVPTGSQDGKRQGTLIPETEVLIPPASRVEFIASAPPGGVQKAELITNAIDGGPLGDSNPARPLALVRLISAPAALPRIPKPNGPPNPQRFENLRNATVTATRKLYFSEINIEDQQSLHRAPDNDKHTLFYITVDGATPTLYQPDNPPAITATQGAVEDWTIENRSAEVHEFHIHQIHFLLEAVNGVPVPKKEQQMFDTHQVGYWDGVSSTYPSITVRMDFRGPVAGDFVYHCHILDHEDGGMMAIIRVLPKT